MQKAKPQTKLIQIRLPESILKRLKMIAFNEGITVNTLARIELARVSNKIFPKETLEEYEDPQEIIHAYNESFKEMEENSLLVANSSKELLEKNT